MSDEPTNDAEVIAALDAFYGSRSTWDNGSGAMYLKDMRDALAAVIKERDDALKRAAHFERQCALETQDASDQEGLKFVAEAKLAAMTKERDAALALTPANKDKS